MIPVTLECAIKNGIRKDIAFDVYTNGQSIVNKTKKLADYYPRLVGISIYSGVPEGLTCKVPCLSYPKIL